MSTRTFGARVERNIDPKLLRGEGAFVDDIPLTSALHAAFLRSPVARARIREINTTAAEAYPGVAAVYTCDDIGTLDMAMPLLIPHPSMKNPKTQRPLARGEVYYVGQTIAFVVAVDRYTAEDAAALIHVEYEALPVEMDLKAALEGGAPRVHSDVPNNLAAHFIQVSGEPDAAFARAEHVTRIEVQVDRGANGVPRGGGAMGCCFGRIDCLGRHPSADLGTWRLGVNLQSRRGQSSGYRA
jgi:aerobic carbon-monoxide dehydrogenase large subunit